MTLVIAFDVFRNCFDIFSIQYCLKNVFTALKRHQIYHVLFFIFNKTADCNQLRSLHCHNSIYTLLVCLSMTLLQVSMKLHVLCLIGENIYLMIESHLLDHTGFKMHMIRVSEIIFTMFSFTKK